MSSLWFKTAFASLYGNCVSASSNVVAKQTFARFLAPIYGCSLSDSQRLSAVQWSIPAWVLCSPPWVPASQPAPSPVAEDGPRPRRARNIPATFVAGCSRGSSTPGPRMVLAPGTSKCVRGAAALSTHTWQAAVGIAQIRITTGFADVTLCV